MHASISMGRWRAKGGGGQKVSGTISKNFPETFHCPRYSSWVATWFGLGDGGVPLDRFVQRSFASRSVGLNPALFILTEDAERLISAKLLRAGEDGCPVAPQKQSLADDMASFSRRRWNSFRRRASDIQNPLKNRIIDLARGMAEKFERGGWSMVWPLINDYHWLAEQIAPLLAKATTDVSDSVPSTAGSNLHSG
jgi:hypothetical protein